MHDVPPSGTQGVPEAPVAVWFEWGNSVWRGEQVAQGVSAGEAPRRGTLTGSRAAHSTA